MELYIGMVLYDSAGFGYLEITDILSGVVFYAYSNNSVHRVACHMQINEVQANIDHGFWIPIPQTNDVELNVPRITSELLITPCEHEFKDYYGLHSFVQYQYCTKCGEKA